VVHPLDIDLDHIDRDAGIEHVIQRHGLYGRAAPTIDRPQRRAAAMVERIAGDADHSRFASGSDRQRFDVCASTQLDVRPQNLESFRPGLDGEDTAHFANRPRHEQGEVADVGADIDGVHARTQQ
jgi:hypothetical protein